MNSDVLEKIANNLNPTKRMPLMFVGHGNPMNAILANDFTRKWKALGNELEKPQAILVISAHWITNNSTKVTSMEIPKTIHDFGGFPDDLFQQQYPAPGAPEVSKATIDLVKNVHIEQDFDWGLDHGTWSVLKPMYPKADIPVYQLSIDYSKPIEFHYNLGKELSELRNKGVLIIGSGNIVHNLSSIKFGGGSTYDWAQEFDSTIAEYIDDRDFNSVINFQNLGELSKMAHPAYDHFLPLLYTLGVVHKTDQITYFNNTFEMGSIAMRSLLIQEQ